MYTQFLDDASQDVRFIEDTESGFYVPLDQNNPRYRNYLSWVAQGNTPKTQILNPKPVSK